MDAFPEHFSLEQLIQDRKDGTILLDDGMINSLRNLRQSAYQEILEAFHAMEKYVVIAFPEKTKKTIIYIIMNELIERFPDIESCVDENHKYEPFDPEEGEYSYNYRIHLS